MSLIKHKMRFQRRVSLIIAILVIMKVLKMEKTMKEMGMKL